MKSTNKILLGSCFIVLLFAVSTSTFAAGADPPVIPIGGDSYQTQLQMNNQTTYRFQQRTQLTINSSVNIQLRINCDAMGIGVKYFELEIEADSDLEMNMTCTEEQAELGLLLGNTNQVRNRNRYRYQEGFCISLECNGTNIQARLKIQVTSQNHLGTWAFYNHSTEEWVAVETTIEDGYLVAETNHLSTWTILIPEAGVDYTLFIIIGVGVITGAILFAAVIYYKKR